jgi:hypothetical protein
LAEARFEIEASFFIQPYTTPLAILRMVYFAPTSGLFGKYNGAHFGSGMVDYIQ